MSERYISVTDDEYVYFLDTQSDDYKTLEDFEKIEFEEAKKDNVDVEEYEDAILASASDKYWDWVYDYHIEVDTVNDLLNSQEEEIQQLKWSNKILRANRKDCEFGRKEERKRWKKMDKMRIEHIQRLQKRLKENGLSIYVYGDDKLEYIKELKSSKQIWNKIYSDIKF